AFQSPALRAVILAAYPEHTEADVLNVSASSLEIALAAIGMMQGPTTTGQALAALLAAAYQDVRVGGRRRTYLIGLLGLHTLGTPWPPTLRAWAKATIGAYTSEPERQADGSRPDEGHADQEDASHLQFVQTPGGTLAPASWS